MECDEFDIFQIAGNDNGYRASIKKLENVYHARYVKIKATQTGSAGFCTRLELCGKVQKPAPVYDVRIIPFQYAARVTWKIRTASKDSSYITSIIFYLNGFEYRKISRQARFTETSITGLDPYTSYILAIVTQDGSLQTSTRISKYFRTRETGEHNCYHT